MDKLNILSLLRDYCFVVPEIQREYVWGTNRLVLSQFLTDLNEKVSKGETNIGFLYSYKSGAEHYLIDGQQRFTTLILLLHYITVKEGVGSHEQYVQMHRLESNLSAFSYRVRSNTESFLKNLLVSSSVTSKQIKQQKWYKSIYGEDSTILSMMSALDEIDKMCDELFNLTSERILNSIYFWYFDVEQTSQGEELYITMNSRGEKLTNPEQIKPRLLNKINNAEKVEYGKLWDEWEEFFFKERIGKEINIEAIDVAMNNVIRIVLEMVTLSEHDKINAIEDADRISLSDIKLYMTSIIKLSEIENGKYCSEIERLYGYGDKYKVRDGNFIILKALLTEIMKNQEDVHEFERIYQTITNGVRRNKIKNIPFLKFINEYKSYDGSFYEFILQSNSDTVKDVINGHELEKVSICSNFDNLNVEHSIWSEQSCDFWNGEMKILIEWSKKNGQFSYEEFERIRNNFHKLFKEKFEKDDWTSDSVRQALISYRLPDYPLGDKFGYSSVEWKEIFYKNSNKILSFLNIFDNVDKENISSVIDNLKNQYEETPDNLWAEFVKFDYFLGYCNTKHLYWTDSYGWLLVKNSWARPFSVRNMRLFHDLEEKYGSTINGWKMEKIISWESCVQLYEDNLQISCDISYRRNNDDTYVLRVDISKYEQPNEEYESLKNELQLFIPSNIRNEWKEDEGKFICYPDSIESLYLLISYITEIK